LAGQNFGRMHDIITTKQKFIHMENYEVLKSLVHSLDEDMKKFTEKGNKAAGGRIRKAMQEIKTLAQAIRVEVQEMKNTKAE
jgi:hypothetical protein